LPTNVLVWGHVDNGACAYFRGYQYDEPLKALGVNIRHISKLDGTAAVTARDGSAIPLEGIPEHLVIARVESGEWKLKYDLDTGPIEWADVVMFRRYYNTALRCQSCGLLASAVSDADAHGAATGHTFARQDDITRTMWPAIAARTDKAILYETDDLHLGRGIQKWNGYWIDVQHERDLITEMTRRADLVTVSTPFLARTYGQYNRRIRVVRNAIDPDLYTTALPRPDTTTRLLYYGSTARLRDYAGRYATGNKADGPGHAYVAVQENKSDLHRIFIGTSEGTEEIIDALFDEQYGYMEDIPGFCRKMADVWPEIGIAPLGGDDFDQNKSELHWLEYTMAGAATIAYRYSGGPDNGPYNVIRHGEDGLLARGAQDWSDSLRRLIREPNLRADLAAVARERVLREYDYRVRAEEWADAFRWASEHRGIGAAQMAA
jgi:glycosyltransferase involved in cell wall biosynthesis